MEERPTELYGHLIPNLDRTMSQLHSYSLGLNLFNRKTIVFDKKNVLFKRPNS